MRQKGPHVGAFLLTTVLMAQMPSQAVLLAEHKSPGHNDMGRSCGPYPTHSGRPLVGSVRVEREMTP